MHRDIIPKRRRQVEALTSGNPPRDVYHLHPHQRTASFLETGTTSTSRWSSEGGGLSRVPVSQPKPTVENSKQNLPTPPSMRAPPCFFYRNWQLSLATPFSSPLSIYRVLFVPFPPPNIELDSLRFTALNVLPQFIQV